MYWQHSLSTSRLPTVLGELAVTICIQNGGPEHRQCVKRLEHEDNQSLSDAKAFIVITYHVNTSNHQARTFHMLQPEF